MMWRTTTGRVAQCALAASLAGVCWSRMPQGEAPPTSEPATKATSPTEIIALGPAQALRDAPQAVPVRVQSKVTGIDGLANERGDAIEYIITLPKGMNPQRAWDLILVLSDTDVPASWQPSALPASTFGEDVIVAAMGPVRMSPEGLMVYQPGGRDSVIARDLILEVTRQVPAGRVFLVGHGAGGSYALATAAAFPRLIAGAVCIDGGLWQNTPMAPLSRMAIALVDQRGGAGRPATWSLDALGVLQEAEHRAARVVWSVSDSQRPFDPDAIAQATLFIRGMASSDATEVLAIVKRLIESRRESLGPTLGSALGPEFGTARLILTRFEPFVPADGMSDDETQRAKLNRYPTEVKDLTDEQRRLAAAMRDAIEAHGLRHVARLRELATRWPVTQAVDANARPIELKFEIDAPVAVWLGHVLDVQHRFAGIESVEQYLREVDLANWQSQLAQQAEAINGLARVKRAMEDQQLIESLAGPDGSVADAIAQFIAQWLDAGGTSSDAPSDLAILLRGLAEKEPTLKDAKGWSEMVDRAAARDRAMQQGRESAAEIDRLFVLPGQ